MRTVAVTADFSRKTTKKIKPLHGVNNSPLSLYEPPPGFREAGIPFCRLHDAAGAYGGSHYVDIPNIFPDFDADPLDPSSYDFALTDAYLSQLHAAGTEIFYRLGTTIENNYRIKGYNNHPPADFSKWAEICAGVIRHYNEGWANGFCFGIRYWEIWNEPENPPMWSGTREQFFELYRIAAIRLKQEFPDIKIGGYASCGFYAVNRPGCTDFFKEFVTWFDEFLKFVTAEETPIPLDFYSWHLYTADPYEILLHSQYVKSKLDEYGLNHVENIFNEWNYLTDDLKRRYWEMKDNEGASFVAASFCLMQNSPIDKAMYYDAYPQRAYCGLYQFPGPVTTHTYTAFCMWNTLYRLGECRKAQSNDKNIFVSAAADSEKKGLLIVNFAPHGCRVKLKLPGIEISGLEGRIIDKRHNNTPFIPAEEFSMPPYSVLLLSSPNLTEDTIEQTSSKHIIHAGLDDRSQES